MLYRNTPENAEVAGDAGIPFEPAELAGKMRRVLDMTDEERDACAAAPWTASANDTPGMRSPTPTKRCFAGYCAAKLRLWRRNPARLR